jgi:cyanophycinase-like exopeptidase
MESAREPQEISRIVTNAVPGTREEAACKPLKTSEKCKMGSAPNAVLDRKHAHTATTAKQPANVVWIAGGDQSRIELESGVLPWANPTWLTARNERPR